jgi:hypothetical protein
MDIEMIQKLFSESQIACARRGLQFEKSSTHLLIYHPNTVDAETERDLQHSEELTGRMLKFYATVGHCFITLEQRPTPFMCAMRPWIISAEKCPNALARVNDLNMETTLQKVTLAKGFYYDLDDPSPKYRGFISVNVPIPENGLTRRDLETITTRLLAVPVEEILEAEDTSEPSPASPSAS